MFPQFADCILQGFRRFYDIVVPPEVFVPVLIHQVVEYLLPFEGILVGDAGYGGIMFAGTLLAGIIDKKIKKVALCGGSDSSLISAAKDSGAQIFITGDLKYHDFLCEDGFMVMDIGHFESETGVLELLRSILLKNLVTFAVRISENNNNLIYYY